MVDEENDYCIGKDLPRTLTFIKSFSIEPSSGQNKLYNVLKAYSCYDKQIGYCQGMNYLAAMLLTHIDDEQEAFWSLVYIMNQHNWRAVFNDKTTKLIELLVQIEDEVSRRFPKVFKHIRHD